MSTAHKIIGRHFYTESTFKLIIEKKGINFLPGQHFSIGVAKYPLNREYSIYNSPKDRNLEFLIKKISNGYVSNQLANEKNKEVTLLGPYSDFIIPESEIKKKFLFIATGTGIAPFSSFVQSFKKLDFKIIFGTKYEKEIYDKEQYGNNIATCISQEGHKKHVQDELKKTNLSEYNYIYLCGNSKMIIDVQNLLQKTKYQGIVKTEVFF